VALARERQFLFAPIDPRCRFIRLLAVIIGALLIPADSASKTQRPMLRFHNEEWEAAAAFRIAGNGADAHAGHEGLQFVRCGTNPRGNGLSDERVCQIT
jgi:hypothetical protein